jgi:toxin ParE1/3/4
VVEIIWTELAVEDLHDIYSYISKDSIFYAINVTNKIVVKIEVLFNFPKIGRIIPEYNEYDYRELIDGNYRIVYWLVNEDFIKIIRICHSKRQLFI